MGLFWRHAATVRQVNWRQQASTAVNSRKAPQRFFGSFRKIREHGSAFAHARSSRRLEKTVRPLPGHHNPPEQLNCQRT
jgi:hypothetical protein